MPLFVGTAARDTLIGSTGADTIDGMDGPDDLAGLGGADLLRGGAGDDIFRIRSASDLETGEVIQGGAGWDRLEIEGTESVDLTRATISGIEELRSASTLTFVGIALLNALQEIELTGAPGGLIEIVGGGSAYLGDISYLDARFRTSSAGNALDFGYIAAAVIVEGQGGADRVVAGNDASTIDGGGGNDTLFGSRGADLLIGGDGNDRLIGARNGTTRDGDDTLDGGAGDDTMLGGAGNDLYRIDSRGDVYVEAQDGGRDTVESSVGISLRAHVEVLTLTGQAAINGNGNVLDNVISGNQAANRIDGREGNDRILAGGGVDTVFGGAGNDTIIASEGNDYVYGGDGDDVTAEAGRSFALLNGGAGNDLFVMDGGIVEAATTISGGDGYDTLLFNGTVITITHLSLSGIEALRGDPRSVYIGIEMTAAQLSSLSLLSKVGVFLADSGDVDLRHAAFEGTTLIRTFQAGSLIDFTGVAGRVPRVDGRGGADTVLGGDGGTEVYGGGGSDSIEGGLAIDWFLGEAGDDVLRGGGGNDWLEGGAGSDKLEGGTGADRFVFLSADVGRDAIVDFNIGEGDQIILNDSMLVGTFVYRGSLGFTGGSNNSEARHVGNDRVEIDANGDGLSDITILFGGVSRADQLSAAHFAWIG